MILVSGTGQHYLLQVGDNTIGRGMDCQFRLEHERVSRHHAVIHWDGHHARITDLGSTNGTNLNGRRLSPQQPYPLSPGDRLEVGDAGVVLEVMPAQQPAAPVVPQAVTPRSSRVVPVWLAALIGALVLLLAFGLAALWAMNRAQQAAPAVASSEPAPTTQPAAETPKPASPVSQPTATLALPAASGAQPGANVGGGAAAPAVAAQLPPLNPTTLPALIAAAPGGLVPGDLASFLGGTPIPGLPSGAPGVTLPSGPKRHNPPRLLSPASGASYQGQDAVIILEWEPVSGLAANEYYWAMVFYRQGGKEQAGGTWVKATSYRVPAWFLSQASGRFEWQVVIVEATGPVEQGGRLGATTSDPSERRWFEWQPGDDSAPPPPPPGPTPTYGG